MLVWSGYIHSTFFSLIINMPLWWYTGAFLLSAISLVQQHITTVYGFVKTKSLEGFGGHHWRSDRLSIGLGGDFAAVEGTTGPITDAFPSPDEGGFTSPAGTVIGNLLDSRDEGTDTSAGPLFNDGGDGSFVFRRWTWLRRTTSWGVSTSCDLSSSRLRTIPFCHSHLPNSNGFILTVSPLFKGSRSTVPLLQYWSFRYLRHSSLPRHSSSSVTGCGARKLAVTGRRLLVLLLKRRCAALTWILASRMLQWSSRAKSIQSTRSALSENLLSFLHCTFCFTITLIMIWAAREMFKVPFSRCEPL